MSKVLKILAIVFLMIGIMFITIGQFSCGAYISLLNNSEKCVGTIVRFAYTDRPVIEYTYNGNTYELTGNSKSSSYRVGDEVTVYVNKDNPTAAQDNTFKILGIIFSSVGGVFILIALGFIAVLIKSKRNRENILLYGRRTTAKINKIIINQNVNINNRNPVRLCCTAVSPETGNTVPVISHDLFNSSYNVGDEVDIVFDRDNDTKYVFDITDK